MKKPKFPESQIIFALKQAETDISVEQVCRKMGISEVIFYKWKKKSGGLGVSELRKNRRLEEENHQLKKLVADLSPDKQTLQDVLKKNFETNPFWGLAQSLLYDYRIPVRRACMVMLLHTQAGMNRFSLIN